MNRYAFPHEKVSRRHALVHAQEGREFWVVDLGSTNGTYVNGDRVALPRKLNGGDLIRLGNMGNGVELLFEYVGSADESAERSAMLKTVIDTLEERRWLLIADLVGFSELSSRLSATQVALDVGTWLATATRHVLDNGARINKYTGDGFLAFWRDQSGVESGVAAALAALREMQAKSSLAFRVVIHVGIVAVGGAPTLGEESLLSPDLSFAFRLEKLAGTLKIPIMLSAPAAASLSRFIDIIPVPGVHELKGYPPVEGLAQVKPSNTH